MNPLTWTKKWARRGFFVAWFLAVLIPGVYQLAEHTLSLPKPVPEKLQAAMIANRPRDATGWVVLHVLYAECGCSGRVADRLTQRGLIPGVAERVIIVGEPKDDLVERLRAHGLSVELTDAKDLSDRYGIVAAPVLVVADPGGTVRYVGGYTEQKRGPAIRDTAIVASLERGEQVDALPILGCAVSRDLQRQVDPLGLKY